MEIDLTIDGEDIPMNDFVQKIITGMVTGAVGSLNDVEPDWKDLELVIKR